MKFSVLITLDDFRLLRRHYIWKKPLSFWYISKKNIKLTISFYSPEELQALISKLTSVSENYQKIPQLDTQKDKGLGLYRWCEN